jgi:hypothetical protein
LTLANSEKQPIASQRTVFGYKGQDQGQAEQQLSFHDGEKFPARAEHRSAGERVRDGVQPFQSRRRKQQY